MADPIIRVKRSTVQGKTPTVEQLGLGEIAINHYDGKLFIRQDLREFKELKVLREFKVLKVLMAPKVLREPKALKECRASKVLHLQQVH